MAPLATLGNARRVGALRRRAFGLCPVPSSPSRPFGVNPSRLRACGAARCACGEGRAPPQGAELVGLRPGLLPQVARKRAVLDAGGSSPVRHEGRFTDTPPGLAMELPRHASSKRPPATSGTLSPCRWALSLPVPGRKPVKPSRGKPSRPCSFRSGSSQGVLSVCESWRWPGFYGCNLPAKTISPALRAFLAGQILFASRLSTVLRPLRGAASPSPAGRITTRTHWRDLVQPERRNHHG